MHNDGTKEVEVKFKGYFEGTADNIQRKSRAQDSRMKLDAVFVRRNPALDLFYDRAGGAFIFPASVVQY